MSVKTAATPKGKSEIPAIPPGVKLTTLDNGLIIIVREDHSAPVVSAQAWAMTGSIHEDRWLGAGLSHVLEHMLFKGTTTRPGSRIDQEVQEAGGYMNAYTSFDRTVYHIDVPNTGARVAIDILCDIMQNAALPPDELAKELDVIRREMDMGQDDPSRRSGRRLFETAYTKSPYRHTVIGYLDIFNELKPDDIRNYYTQRYAPNNVFYVIVGDVKHDEVIAQIREAYAKSKSRALPPVLLPLEPHQTAAREIIEEAAIELGHLHFAWHIPELRHADVPALDVLAVLLGSGRSSRLYREVREKKGLVNYADAWTYNPGNPGLFGMSAVVDADKFTKAREALLAEVEKLKTKPVAKAEVQKAVKQFISGTLASRKTMQGQAADLGGSWLAVGDLNFSQRYLAAVKRITPADLKRVARKYLTQENSTLYALLPDGTKSKTSSVVETNTEHPIQKFVLPNGLRLLIKESHRLPFVEFRAVFQGGVLAENPVNNGITQLMARLIVKGTKTRSAEQISGEIESVGGSLDSYGGNNSFGINAEVMSSDFATGLELVADVILNPKFPAAQLDREREVQISGIRSQKDDLLKSAFKAMRHEMFGDSSYGLDSLGSEETLPHISSTDIQTFHRKIATPENCVIAIYGDVDTARTKAAVIKAFGKWKRGDFKLKAQDSALGTAKRATETRDKKQAVVVIGFPGTTLSAEDRQPMELLQEACSDLGSRLFLRIREKLGLAYYVGAQNLMGLTPGYFAFYAGTDPEKAALVEAEMMKEVELLRTESLTQEELDRAKKKIIGQRKISRQDIGSVATSSSLDELYGLGYNHSDEEDKRVLAVTLAEVKAVARKYLRPDAAVVAVLSPEKK